MADLSSGPGQARSQNGRTMGSTLPVPTTSTTKPKSPREIMREREKREADRQAMRQMQEEERNRTRTGRTSDTAAGVGGSGEGIENRRSRQSQEQKIADRLPAAQPVSPMAARGDAQTRADSGARSTSQPLPQQSTRPGRTKANTQPAPQQREPQPRAASNPAGTTRNPDNATRQSSTATNNPTRNSSTTFPHAFERWETLSSHWEGLTSFWIKRLQGNSEELRDQPINQQLARQVTDLSAAGANLFHAVVELQRLRASSERKFQRWFFETRADQEKTAERIAQLEAELNDARQGRAPAVAAPAPAAPSPEEVRKQAERLAADEIERVRRECALQIREKNRELEISREEARRGWEEIGRMETENRDRTYTLRRGERTMIGGVEVVPLVVGGSGHSRGASAGGLSSHPTGPEEPNYAPYDVGSETGTDPFTETGRQDQKLDQPTTPRQPQSSSAAIQAARTRTTGASPARPQTAGQPFVSSSAYAAEPLSAATAGGFYQQIGVGTSLQPTQARTADPGYMTSELSEDDYNTGEATVDQYGQPIRPRTGSPSDISNEYDVLERLERDQLFSRGYPPETSAGPPSGTSAAAAQRYTTTSNGGTYQAPDYSGSGYGDWSSAVPRHHHPSRLSDVLEEDERSRTSETSRRRHQQ